MYSKRNESTIKKAFTGFIHNKHQLLVSGMRNMLQDAVMFIYEEHMLEGHENHLEYGDTYGWALYYNGKMIDKKINTGPEISDFSVSDELSSRISAYPGYVGVIMAGMDPKAFFIERYEEEYLHNAAAMLAAEYIRHFKK